jgi:hypothetical protein
MTREPLATLENIADAWEQGNKTNMLPPQKIINSMRSPYHQ